LIARSRGALLHDGIFTRWMRLVQQSRNRALGRCAAVPEAVFDSHCDFSPVILGTSPQHGYDIDNTQYLL
jgi:hypothetical protein